MPFAKRLVPVAVSPVNSEETLQSDLLKNL